jgi:uncharacterized protein YigA (DUF484 family)
VTPASGSATAGVQGITEADIADYLAASPGFFERHAELLSAITLTSPHGHRAVSLQERQMEMLRDKIKGLEHRIIEMIRHSQDNMTSADKLHRWTRALMLTINAAELPDTLVHELLSQFLIPQGAVRVWGAAEAFASLSFATPVSDDVREFASSLSVPYCGVNADFEAARWLEDAAAVRSIAMIPLRDDASPLAFGLLVLASPDPTRYTADMGTEFLERIGELASAALARLLPAG